MFRLGRKGLFQFHCVKGLNFQLISDLYIYACGCGDEAGSLRERRDARVSGTNPIKIAPPPGIGESFNFPSGSTRLRSQDVRGISSNKEHIAVEQHRTATGVVGRLGAGRWLKFRARLSEHEGWRSCSARR